MSRKILDIFMLSINNLTQLLSINKFFVNIHAHLILEMRISHSIGTHNLGNGWAPVLLTLTWMLVYLKTKQILTNCPSQWWSHFFSWALYQIFQLKRKRKIYKISESWIEWLRMITNCDNHTTTTTIISRATCHLRDPWLSWSVLNLSPRFISTMTITF